MSVRVDSFNETHHVLSLKCFAQLDVKDLYQ
jgi:hypothetical protein